MTISRRSLMALPFAITLEQLLGNKLGFAQTVGSPLKLFPAMKLDGELYTPEPVEGKVTLLYVWASWCPYCLQDLPALREKQDALRSKGFSILGVNADKDIDQALSWTKTHKVNFPSVRLTADYRGTYLPKQLVTPAWWLAGRDGIVVDSAIGGGSEFRYRQRADFIEKVVAR